MNNSDEIKKIQIRSEEVQEILGQTPAWIIRKGILIIFIIFLLLLTGSYFFSYPEIIPARIVVITKNPPVSIVAKSNGKITGIFVTDNQVIESNTVLGLIENPSNFKDVLSLKQSLDSLMPFISSYDTLHLVRFKNNYSLGDLQASFGCFLKTYGDYINFLRLNFSKQKIISLSKQVNDYKNYYSKLVVQKDIQFNDFFITKKQYARDSSLCAKNVISVAEFEKAESTMLQKKYQYENANTVLANTQIQITQVEQQVLDMKIQAAEQKNKLQQAIKESYENLLSQVAAWEQAYVLKSPIKGKVTFTKIWTNNQDVMADDIVFTVVPMQKSEITGKVKLPVAGSGKVKAGQKVNIKIDNYPFREYGQLRGFIQNISLVTADNMYVVEVSLADSLVTNYGKKLKFSQQMQGTAEIVTDDKSLLERIMEPVKAALNK
ncbi:MAG: hypothetical protein A2275_04610 [Bacteroidetes bacterium RIFOXYA12_FULL_35_11]|nr:MAG: hypothetical protein A2X01_13855 [Bacteroidetes bacterium GWF2_35_48]OFY75625.1 MAG: hypothetical protein A2275_04610 [Bacteroidetes bacterium RIFOXYA12_FULL_35_11]OFY93441.1 MAG: hypothetical protein A2309_08100 [Bacteroidetes bacterium RIFOXYB2_FULL_35_7]OFY94935.1 MAG: hypothetical protein A2491_12060 [Bacteroidetes bacterium RIFOXYC12_FULL_35_7]HBX52085.1 HlyD family secretion protein [Bacteroidales bacterium]